MATMHRRITWIFASANVLACILSAPRWAMAGDAIPSVNGSDAPPIASQPTPASKPAPSGPERLDPAAARILRDWSSFLVKNNRFEVDVQTRVRVQGTELTTDLKSSYHLVVERPNRLALRPQKPELDPTLISDGKTLYSFLPIAKQYTQEPAPESLDRLLAGNSARVLLAGGSALAHLTLVLCNDPFDNLTILATAGRQVGSEAIDGATCDRLSVLQHFFEFELWIEAGSRPLLRRLAPAIVATSQPATGPTGPEPQNPARRVRLETSLSFSNWHLGPELPADAFRFIPPPGARKVAQLLTSPAAGEPDPLLGHAAPTFAVPLLDGSTFNLAAHKGQDIVVLDFWASWSSGSAQRLPTHARLAKGFADRHVAFLAINVDDIERFARAFLEKNEIGLPAALDRDASIAKLYGVRKLPHTVVIAKDGRVAAIHGPSPENIELELRSEVDNLLAGQKLAP